MSLHRRDFLWAMGTGVAAFALQQSGEVRWTSAEAAEAGWEPGLEEKIASTCLVCPARCGVRGRVVDGRLVRLEGNPLHPMSRGGLCPRGAGATQTLYHPDRLRAPRVRIGPRGSGRWREVSPAGAVALLARRLGELRAAGRPHAVGLLAGHTGGTMEELWRRFLQAYGSPNYVADGYDDGTDALMAAMHGIARQPGYDLERASLVVSFGAPLFEAWWSPLQAYVAFGRTTERRQRLPRFVQVDTRFSRTAARCHQWVGIRPQGYGPLALGIAYVLLKEERYDAEFVARRVSGFEDWVDETGERREGYRSLVLRHYRTEEVSAATGVPVERIVALARAFAEAPAPLAVVGTGATLAPDGLLAAMAVHSLNVITGSVNRAGGVLVGDDPPLAPLAPLRADDIARASLAIRPVAAAPPLGRPGAHRLAQALGGAPPAEGAGAGTGDAPGGQAELDTLLLYYTNPLASSPYREEFAAALERVPFVVSFSPFLDETARVADLIIPDLLPAERWQDAPAPPAYPYPVWSLVRPLVAPPAGAIATGDAVLALAQALGGPVAASLPYPDMETLLKARARGPFEMRRGMGFGTEFESAHLRQMEERGWWLAEETDFEAFWADLVRRGGWTDPYYDDTDPTRLARTASGRIELIPAVVRAALAGLSPRPELYRLSAQPGEPKWEEQFPLRLNPYRVSTLASGTLSLEPWLAERPTTFPNVYWLPWVEASPETARHLGLSDGAAVFVVSARGRYRAQLKVFPGAAPGTLNAPYGLRESEDKGAGGAGRPRGAWGKPANPLPLLTRSEDPLTGLLSWCSTGVRLERA